MHETARALSAELDGKMGALQSLIADADRAAARLEKSLAGDPPDVEQSERPDSRPPDQAEALKSPTRSQPFPDDVEQAESPRRDPTEIHTLSDYGYAPAEIASRLGVPIGEIELILALRAKR